MSEEDWVTETVQDNVNIEELNKIPEVLSPQNDDSTDKLKPILKQKQRKSRVAFESIEDAKDLENGEHSTKMPGTEGEESVPNQLHNRKAIDSLKLERFRRRSSQIIRRSSYRYVSFIVPRSSMRFSFESTDGGLYERRVNFWPPPVLMVTISIIQIIIMIIDFSYEDPDTCEKPISKVLRFIPCDRIKFYRFISYALIHSNWQHLCMNLLIQIFLGVPLEVAHGFWRVLGIYSAGISIGVLGQSMFTVASLTGSSGGCYALLFAHIANILINWKDMAYGIPQLFIYLLFVCTDLGLACVSQFDDNEKSSISNITHFFGGMSGLLVGFVILKNLTTLEWQRKMGKAAFVLFLMFVLISVSYQIDKPEDNFCSHLNKTRIKCVNGREIYFYKSNVSSLITEHPHHICFCQPK